MIEVFYCLEPAIKLVCDNNANLSHLKLADVEWTAIKLIISYLQIYKQVLDLLSSETYATLPMAVLAINILIDKVEKIVCDLDKKRERSHSDEILIVAFQKGRDKILKH